jgi:serine/threonine-protein kinase
VDDDAATLPGTLGELPGERARATLDPEGDRYALGSTLGRGGMGEVRLARDMRIDRDVAVKLLRSDQCDASTIARFFREAQVQGRLDHPSVVPVHDLGIDRAGVPYFVMKRLTGTTLADVLANPAMREKWPRRLLLARLVDVCLAVEFAHTRGVVHRDLKPANLMLGDFGEAYVLDWGLARLADDVRDSIRSPSADFGPGKTVAGDILGTPGYMPPEQAQGEEVDARSDVYALGCILYEVLTGAPALPSGMAGLHASVANACVRPSERFSEIPLELDDACASATAADRTKRPTARALAETIQAYLDGDRDLARRREIALVHVGRARDALHGSGDESRALAIREAGRALVLDAANVDAQAVLAQLLLEAPHAIPAEALAAAEVERAAIRQTSLRWVASGYIVVLVAMIVLFVFVFPVRVVWPVATMIATTALTNSFLLYATRRQLRTRSPVYMLAILANAAAIASGGLVTGPLLVLPVFLICTLTAALSQPFGYSPRAIVLPYVIAMAVPLVGEWVGLLPSTYHVEHHALVLTPWAIDLTPGPTIALNLLSIASQAMIASSLMISQSRAQRQAQDRVHAQSWHLRQLLPRASLRHRKDVR